MLITIYPSFKYTPILKQINNVLRCACKRYQIQELSYNTIFNYFYFDGL